MTKTTSNPAKNNSDNLNVGIKIFFNEPASATQSGQNNSAQSSDYDCKHNVDIQTLQPPNWVHAWQAFSQSVCAESKLFLSLVCCTVQDCSSQWNLNVIWGQSKFMFQRLTFMLLQHDWCDHKQTHAGSYGLKSCSGWLKIWGGTRWSRCTVTHKQIWWKHKGTVFLNLTGISEALV